MAQSAMRTTRGDDWSTSMSCCMPTPYTARNTSKPTDTDAEITLYFDQPTVQAPPTYVAKDCEPMPHPVKAATWFESHAGQMRSRASSLSFHSLLWPSQSRSRPRIGAPMDFRHLAGSTIDPPRPTRHRRLELSIYLPQNRLSDLPNFQTSDWEQKLEEICRPAPALLRSYTDSDLERPHQVPRKPISMPPVLRQSAYGELNDAHLSLENGPGPILTESEFGGRPASELAKDLDFGLIMTSRGHQDLCTLQQAAPVHARSESNSSFRTFISSPKSGRSWSQSDFTRHLRSASSRQAKPDPVDLAITELNNIVKERRLSALSKSMSVDQQASSGPLSPTHVPAIAPSMKLKARSETLSDIGSAFSVPLSARSPRSPHDQYTPSLLSPRSPREQMQVSPGSNAFGTTTLRVSTKSRLANWLGVAPTHSIPAGQIPGPSDGFYSLQPSRDNQAALNHAQRPSTSTIGSDISTIDTPSEQSFGNLDENMTPATSVFSPTSVISTSPFAQHKNEYAPSRPSLSTLISSPRSSNSLKHRVQISSQAIAEDSGKEMMSTPSGLPPPYSSIERDAVERVRGNMVVGMAF